MDPAWTPVVFGLGGATAAAVWSFLMAKYVAGPRAKTLMVNVLRGETEEDAQIVEEIRSSLIRPELNKLTLTDGVDKLSAKLECIPQSIGELLEVKLDTTAKSLGNHFSQNLDSAVAHLQKELPNVVEQKVLAGKRFAGAPAEAQAKSVESRRANQIVAVLEDQVMGPSIAAKARELQDFLASVGQHDLADWLEENQDAITQVERRIRANPALASRIQQMQQRFAGGAGARGTGGVDI